MRGILRHRPAPALVVSVVALVVASAGGASALQGSAARAPRLVVGSHSIHAHVAKGSSTRVRAACPESGSFRGTKVISGGYVTDSGFVYAIESDADVADNSYYVTMVYPPTVNNESGADFIVTVNCAKVK